MAFLDAPRPPHLLLKNKTAATLASENPVLALGERRYETDTKKYKVGDGVTAWNSLGYGVDADAAANINDPASSTRTALNAAFAPVNAQLRGQRLVVLGDSITIAAEFGTLTTNRAPSYGSMATFLSKGRLPYVRNAGIQGNTSAQMLARFDADVAAYSPSLVHVLAGTNDSNDAAPVATADYAANIKALVAKIRGIGAQPILGTVPPNDTSTTRKTRITAYNAWLRRYAMTEGITLIDYYGLLVDPANGNYLATYYSDGTHPNNLGQIAMGTLLWNTLSPLLQTTSSTFPQDAVDPNNLLAGSLFLAATGVGTGAAHLQPNGWTLNGSAHPAGSTADLVTGDTSIKGNWYRITMSGTNGSSLIYQNIAGAKVIPGHRYLFTGKFKTGSFLNTDTGARPFIYSRILFNGTQNSPNYDLRAIANNWSYQVDDGAFYVEAVAPSDAASLQAQFTIGTTGGAASGSAQVAQLGLYDLTAMGVV